MLKFLIASAVILYFWVSHDFELSRQLKLHGMPVDQSLENETFILGFILIINFLLVIFGGAIKLFGGNKNKSAPGDRKKNK